MLDHCELVPFADLGALERALRRRDVASFIVEPVQGEGGAVVPPKHYLSLTSYYDFDPRVIRFEPPLTVTEEQIDEAVDALDAVLSRGKPAIALSFGRTAIGSILRR